MTRTERARTPWLAATFLLLAACGAPSRPNVLMISIDTLRADHLGSYGYERDTSPRIDRLAREGALFETVVSSTSWTLPAHASMLTGLPDEVHRCDRDSAVLAPERYTLAEALRDRGYRTAGFWSGPYLHPHYGLDQGFEHYQSCAGFEVYKDKDLEEIGPTGWVRRRAFKLSHSDISSQRLLAEVGNWLGEHGDEPFFVFVHMWDVHYDYIPPPPYDRMFIDPGYAGPMDGTDLSNLSRLKGLTPGDVRRIVDLYDGEIAWTDHHVGGMLDVLDELGLAEDTVVVVTSDHGEEFFEHDRFGHNKTLFEESVRVPLIIRYPRSVPAGRRVSALARMVDIAPTVMDLAGLDPLPNVLGRSLVPHLNGGPPPEAEPALMELVEGRKRPPQFALRTQDWKWIVRRDDGGPVGLYDLRADPDERRDLSVSNPELRAEAEAASARAQATLRALELLHPEGAAASPSLPEELKRQLEGLGYLDGADPE